MRQKIAQFNRILRTRQQEMDIVSTELAVRQEQQTGIIKKIDEIDTQKKDAMTSFCTPRNEVIDPRTLWYERQNLDVLENGLNNKKKELHHCQNAIEETKERLVERHRSVRIMEQYVTKLTDKHTEEELHTEQKKLDDISSQRFSMRLREGSIL